MFADGQLQEMLVTMLQTLSEEGEGLGARLLFLNGRRKIGSDEVWALVTLRMEGLFA